MCYSRTYDGSSVLQSHPGPKVAIAERSTLRRSSSSSSSQPPPVGNKFYNNQPRHPPQSTIRVLSRVESTHRQPSRRWLTECQWWCLDSCPKKQTVPAKNRSHWGKFVSKPEEWKEARVYCRALPPLCGCTHKSSSNLCNSIDVMGFGGNLSASSHRPQSLPNTHWGVVN